MLAAIVAAILSIFGGHQALSHPASNAAAAAASVVPSAIVATSSTSTASATSTAASSTIVYQTINQPVIERIIDQQSASTGVSESELGSKLNRLENKLTSLIYSWTGAQGGDPASSVPNSIGAGGVWNAIAGTNKIDRLSGVTISNSTIDAASIPSLPYLSTSGGTVSGDLTVSGTFNGGSLNLTNASSTNLSVFSNAYFGGMATSSFDSTGALTLATPLGINSGGTGTNSFGQGWLYSNGGTEALAASTSPTVNYITATSTTATSTFAGPIDGTIVRDMPIGNPTTLLKINGAGSGGSLDDQFSLSAMAFDVNPGDRPNNVMSMGWNTGTNGLPIIAGRASARIAIESHYFGYGDGPVFEWHLMSAFSTTSKEYRGISGVFEKNTNHFQIGFDTEQFSMSNTANTNQYLAIKSNGDAASAGGTWNVNGTSTIYLNANNLAVLTQENAAGTGHISLPMINNSDKTVLNPNGNEVTTSGSATTTITGHLAGNPDLYLQKNLLGVVYVGNPQALGVNSTLSVQTRQNSDGITVVAGGFTQPTLGLLDYSHTKGASLRLAGGSDDLLQLGGGGAGQGSLSAIDIGTDVIGSASHPYLEIGSSKSYFSSGKVGIGTTSPATLLEVGGSTANVTLDGYTNCTGFTSNANGLVACTASDQRLKQDIMALDASSTLAALDELNPISFYWRPETQRGSAEQFGLVAQDVQKIFPNLVATTSPTSLTPDGTLTVNYDGLIAPMIVAIQQLSHDVIDLTSNIASFAESFTTKELTFTRATGDEIDIQKAQTHELCIDDVCMTRDQLLAVLAGTSATSAVPADAGGSSDSTTPDTPTTPDTTPPVIAINGSNPAHITVGASYADLGATETDNVDKNLGLKYFLNGALVSNIVLDTSVAATDTIDYVATDSAGNTATSTRTVIVEAPAFSIPSSPAVDTTATTTTATTTAQ